MSVINVTMFVDIAGILSDKTYSINPSQPVVLEGFQKYTFFLTDWSDVNFGSTYGVRAKGESSDEGSYYIDVKANIGDYLRFRVTGLTLGFEYQCFIHPFSFSAQTVASDPKAVANSNSVAVQQQDGGIVSGSAEDYYMEAEVKGNGRVTYTITFSVFDSTGTRVGILSLDPGITIPGVSRYAVG